MTVTNANAPDSVRLIDIVYDLTISPGRVAKLKEPGSAIIDSRATIDRSAPGAHNTPPEMFVFPTISASRPKRPTPR